MSRVSCVHRATQQPDSAETSIRPTSAFALGHPFDLPAVFALDRLPPPLAVIGGGPIGVELGQVFARFGATVTILQRALRLLAREPEVSRHLAEVLGREGIDVRLSCTITSVRRAGDAKVLTVEGEADVVADEIFVAGGRRSSLDGLDLEAARIETSPRGVLVDDALRTSQPHVFAVGDCSGGPQFTHWAEYEARLATRNSLSRQRAPLDAHRTVGHPLRSGGRARRHDRTRGARGARRRRARPSVSFPSITGSRRG